MVAAVRVTDVPLQTVVRGVVITMLTGFTVFSTIVIEFDVAGLPEGQATLEVRMQWTISPLAGIYVIDGMVCTIPPTPLINH